MTNNDKTLIIDTPYLCHRAKWSTGDLSHDGEATGTIYGVLRDIEILKRIHDPDVMVFCFDSKHSKRKKLYSGYKANRKHPERTKAEWAFEDAFRRQIKLLRTRYLRMMGYNNIAFQKGYEADDHIAATLNALPRHKNAVIVTADHDMYQCLRQGVTIYNPQKKDNQYYTTKSFKDEFGVAPSRWPFIKAVAGCSSDCIPGVPGVGEKTVIKYLKGEIRRGTKTFYKIHSFVKGRQRKSEPMWRNLKLVTLPFPGTALSRIHPDRPHERGQRLVYRELGIRSIP